VASNRDLIGKQIVDISMFRSMVSAMDDTMDWFSSIGERVRVFGDMMTDPRIESLIETRQDRVLRLDMGQKDGPNERINKATKEAISYNKINKLCMQLLQAIPNGIAVPEIVWDKDPVSGLIVPVNFLPIPYSLISFPYSGGKDWDVPVCSPIQKRLDDENKFIIHRNDRGTGSPWGKPVLKSVYWPWKFKKLGFRFWIMAAERIGVPSILAIFEAKDDTEVKKRANILTDLLSKIRSGSSAALGNVKDVKYLDASGANKDFDVIIKVCNTEISYGITGQSLVTNEAEYGTKAQGVLHEGTIDATVYSDAQILQPSVQKLYDYFSNINFPGEKPLQFEIDAGEHATWETIKDAINLGIPVSKKAIYESHKIPEPESPDDVFIKPMGYPSVTNFSDEERFFFRTQPQKKRNEGF